MPHLGTIEPGGTSGALNTRAKVFHKYHEGGYTDLTDAQVDLTILYMGQGASTFDAQQSAVMDLIAYQQYPAGFLQWNFEDAPWHEFKTQATQASGAAMKKLTEQGLPPTAVVTAEVPKAAPTMTDPALLPPLPTEPSPAFVPPVSLIEPGGGTPACLLYTSDAADE